MGWLTRSMMCGALALAGAARAEPAPVKAPVKAGEKAAAQPETARVLGAEAASPAVEEAIEALAAARATALTASVTLKVVHPDDVRRRLVEAAAPLGGFPTLVESQRLVLKVPPEQLDRLLDTVTGAGLLISKELSRADLTGEIAQLEALLRSKRQIFTRLRALVDAADTQATLRIEQTMSGLVAEMEALAGRLRVERARVQHAVIDVSFQFRARQRIVYVRSPFEWLNSVDVRQFDARF